MESTPSVPQADIRKVMMRSFEVLYDFEE